jgi:uncharacterized membrane protein
VLEKTEMKILNMLCADSRTDAEQDLINQEEWENPKNWTSRFIYSSKKDSRPIVPKPEGQPPPKYAINRGHPRGKFWIFLMNIFIILVTLMFVFLVPWKTIF